MDPVVIQLREQYISDDNRGIARTVQAILTHIRSATSQTAVMPLAHFMTTSLPGGIGRSSYSRAVSAYWIVRSTVIFSDDAPGREELKTPAYLLHEIERQGYATGDCDDMAIFLGSLLVGLRVPFSLVLISRNQEGVYDHIYIIAETERGRLALDPSVPEYPGWEPPDDEITAKAKLPV